MKQGKKGSSLVSKLVSAIGVTLIALTTHAGILSVSNQVTVISPPTSFFDGVFSNNQIYVFPEQSAAVLTNSVTADISTPGTVTNNSLLSLISIPANTTVDSYYLRHGGPGPATNLATGSITFDSDVLGVICLSSNLISSQQVLAAPGTLYFGPDGYELGASTSSDSITLSSDFRTVTMKSVSAFFAPDDIRIVTAAPPPPLPPVTIARSNQLVYPGYLVVLDGSGSYDPNSPPLPLTYSWTQISGVSASLFPFPPFAGLFVPDVPDSGDVLVFQLEVSNGYSSSSNFVVITVAGALNTPPIADAGPNQTVAENSLVTLDGSASIDWNADLLTLQWTQISGPVVSLTNADTVNPSFTAPEVTGDPITLRFQLVVNDGQVNSGPSVVTVTVTNAADVPTANAGTNQTVSELSTVMLDGTGSSDPGGKTLTYSWTQILGIPVTLNDAGTVTPSFTAPQLDMGGTNGSTTLTFQLAVSNGDATNTSTVDVFVNNVNHSPIADADLDLTVPSGGFVALIGTNSFDPDGDLLAYAWTQTSGPTVTLNGDNTGSPWFIAPTVGPSGAVLTFELTVSDDFGGVDTDDVTINVNYVNHPPIANAGASQTVNEGSIATLAGTASDPDGNTLTIQWTQLSGPPITLINDTTLAPSFIAPSVTRAETNVVLKLTVNDGYGGIATSNTTVHIANVNHAPVAQAPANMSVSEGSSVSLIGQGTDPDTEEQSALVYSWTQIAGPTVSISNTGANASFTAPLISSGGDTNVTVTLTFALTVTDPNGASGTNSVDVVVANVNHAPTAVVGNNLTVNEGASVTLNGSASSDPDSDSLTYSWVQVSGPAVALTGTNTSLPQFMAPFVNTTGATLQFQLTVNDGFGGTSTATTTVTVNNINTPPNVAHAQPSVTTLWPPNHSMVKVSILGIIDPENNATLQITGVTQDEPTNGNGDGDTDVDAVINNDGTVLLRAERSGNGNGRVYHVHFIASDFEGSASGVVNVNVPHNKNATVIDGGELYDSTN